MIKKYIHCLFIIFAMYYPSSGQPYSFHHITTDDGLSQNSVISIAQDSIGFLYFATQDGLNKYDGSNFRLYGEYFRDITRDNYSQLGKVRIDNNNGLWITTRDSTLKYFVAETNDFKPIEGVKDPSDIVQVSQDTFLASSYSKGLYELIRYDDTFEVSHIIKKKTINQIQIDGSRILLATNKGIISYPEKEPDPIFASVADKAISNIDINQQMKTITVGTYGNGVFQSVNEKPLSQIHTIPTKLNVQDIHTDRNQRLWIASYGEGVYLLENGTLRHFTFSNQNQKSINYKDVLCIFEDDQSNIWFGTDGGGVSYIDVHTKPIYSISNQQLPADYPVDVTRAISTDKDGNIWIGTSGKGLTIVDKSLMKLKHYSTNQTSKYNIINDRIMTIYHDEQNNAWLGTQEDCLLFYEASTQNIKQIKSLPCKTIWDIEYADPEHLWICTLESGLLKFNRLTNEYKQYDESNSGLNSKNIRVISKGQSPNEFYLGTEEGNVFFFNSDTESFRRLELGRSHSGSIKSLYLHNEKLWIGTAQSGIIIYDVKAYTSQVINKSNGLKNNVVYAILPQNDVYMWISSNSGISQLSINKCYNEDESVINQHFTKENGLVSNEFNTGAYHVDTSGNLYFGGIDGINYFKPSTILKETASTDIIFLDLITTDINGQHIKSIYDKESIKLEHEERNFQIRYVTKDFSKSKNNRFQYKLEGIHDSWIDNEKNELVSLSNIPPGEYKFLVKATNEDGVWSKNPAGIDITIIPTFWQTGWFSLLMMAILTMILWLLYKYRINQLNKASSLKERALKAEARALKSQINPHFIFNSLNSIDNFIINKEPEIASDYLTKFSKLMRNILEFSDKEKLSLSEELELLKVYMQMEQLRFRNKFDFNINVDEELNADKITIPPMILQPFIENSIWHGFLHKEGEGLITINVIKNNNDIDIEIIDNGIGRTNSQAANLQTAKKKKSFGMSITSERMKLLSEIEAKGGRIDVEDLNGVKENENGTKVNIHFNDILIEN